MTPDHLEDRLRRVLADAASQLPVTTPGPASVMAAAQPTHGRVHRGRGIKRAWLPSLGSAVTLLAVLAAVAIGVGSIALLAHSGPRRPAAGTSRSAVGDHLAGGKTALLAAVRRLRGQPVVITVWASWCQPCRRNLRAIEAASRQYRGQVAFLGIDANDAKRAGNRLLRSDPLGFPSYHTTYDLRPLLTDPVRAIPTTIFISRAGNIDGESFGAYLSRSQLDRAIARILRAGGGDPASDVLLEQNVFYPFEPAVSASLESQLNAATSAAGSKGFPIKVALIGSRLDLGIIPQLFGKPQAYARYLDFEISIKHLRPLLVVMKGGYGVAGLPAAATAAAAKLSAPAAGTPNGLAAAALSAVTKLSAAAGHRLQ